MMLIIIQYKRKNQEVPSSIRYSVTWKIDKGYVLVTVGSTKFDELIEEVDSDSFVSTISSLGYKGIHIQYGRGQYIPHKAKGTEIVAFDFKESLQKEIKEASLIISHAGIISEACESTN